MAAYACTHRHKFSSHVQCVFFTSCVIMAPFLQHGSSCSAGVMRKAGEGRGGGGDACAPTIRGYDALYSILVSLHTCSLAHYNMLRIFGVIAHYRTCLHVHAYTGSLPQRHVKTARGNLVRGVLSTLLISIKIIHAHMSRYSGKNDRFRPKYD